MIKDYNYAYLTGEITAENVDPIIEEILELNLLKKKKPKAYKIIINTEGGDLTPAFALIDVMECSEIPIHTLGLGEVYSAGLIILMAGAKGFRSASRNTFLMSHQILHPPIEGKASEYISYMKSIDISTKMMVDHYKRHTMLDEELIKNDLLNNTDVYLSPEEGITYNLIDNIETGVKS